MLRRPELNYRENDLYDFDDRQNRRATLLEKFLPVYEKLFGKIEVQGCELFADNNEYPKIVVIEGDKFSGHEKSQDIPQIAYALYKAGIRQNDMNFLVNAEYLKSLNFEGLPESLGKRLRQHIWCDTGLIGVYAQRNKKQIEQLLVSYCPESADWLDEEGKIVDQESLDRETQKVEDSQKEYSKESRGSLRNILKLLHTKPEQKDKKPVLIIFEEGAWIEVRKERKQTIAKLKKIELLLNHHKLTSIKRSRLEQKKEILENQLYKITKREKFIGSYQNLGLGGAQNLAARTGTDIIYAEINHPDYPKRTRFYKKSKHIKNGQ